MRYRTTFVVQIVSLLLVLAVAGAAQATGASRAVAVTLAAVVVLPVMVAVIRRGYRREEERVAAMPDRDAAALRLRAARNAALVLPLLVAAVVLIGPPGNPFGWLYVVLIVAAAGVAWRDWRRQTRTSRG